MRRALLIPAVFFAAQRARSGVGWGPERGRAQWRFEPAMLNGQPVETKLTRVSRREPITETEFREYMEKRRLP